ncbi:hypothetical protein FA95DRAFT_834740 [Auriscalpium vulgare]|uniref:Uncharacterized protein n=1 Tax=Auriscalpium vulgare TaxID=40419 RepID=A0ACB8S169_9AGAM|nr:hypothetical protein FA95DRAFT_834740 [Auriscalpium vulgare]
MSASLSTAQNKSPRTAARSAKEKQSQQSASTSAPRPNKEPLRSPAPQANIVQPRQPQYQSQTKKLARRSSKPILDWFQRKLGGSVRARRASDVTRGRAANGELGTGGRGQRRPTLPDGFRELSRVQSTPSRGRSSGDRDLRRRSQAVDSLAPSRHAALTLNDQDHDPAADGEDASTYRSSLAQESMWSPTSNLEADEDASVRPLPPSSPPSPSPSRSSSSYLSNPRTFKSMAASTKPTTLLSVDITNGMAHIAQAPPTPNLMQRLPAHFWPSGGGSGGGSISFSALPPSPSSSRSPSVQNSYNPNYGSPAQFGGNGQPVQAPQHTTHHPRNNPRPSSPPLDNASVLTLASSAFGIPGARIGVAGGTTDATSISHLSQFGGSRLVSEDRSSHFVLGDELDVEERDVDASVRALRPRSSRRGSWESEASGWSARMGNGSIMGLAGTPAGHREKTFWPPSARTGRISVDNGNEEDDDGQESAYSGDTRSKDISVAPSPVSAQRENCPLEDTVPSSQTISRPAQLAPSSSHEELDATPKHEAAELAPADPSTAVEGEAAVPVHKSPAASDGSSHSSEPGLP